MFRFYRVSFSVLWSDSNSDWNSVFNVFSQVLEFYRITLIYFIDIFRIFEFQRKNSEIHKVLPSNSRIRFGQYRHLSKISWSDGSVFTAGTLRIIITGHNDMPTIFLLTFKGSVVEAIVDNRKGKLTDLRNITTIWQHFSSCFQNFICRNIISHFQ